MKNDTPLQPNEKLTEQQAKDYLRSQGYRVEWRYQRKNNFSGRDDGGMYYWFIHDPFLDITRETNTMGLKGIASRMKKSRDAAWSEAFKTGVACEQMYPAGKEVAQ